MGSPDPTGPNAAYVAQLLEDYLDAPASVPPEWRRIFEADAETWRAADTAAAAVPVPRGNGAAATKAPTTARAQPSAGAATAPAESEPAAETVDPTLLGAVAAAMALVKAYRMHGHLAARLDPLGSEPMGDPALDETRLVPALTPDVQARIPASLLRLSVPGDTLLEALPSLREVYTGSSAYEIEHISDHAERVWLRKAIESGRFRVGLAPEQRATPPSAPDAGGGLRAVSPAFVPRAEAVLARGDGRARSHARRGDRARRRRPVRTRS